MNKACDHIHKKQGERKRVRQEINLLRRECEQLQQQIANSQEQLPETGIPLSKARSDRIQKEFNAYVAQRTEQNFKFYPFALVMRGLFQSYTSVVSASDTARFQQTAAQWLQNHCK